MICAECWCMYDSCSFSTQLAVTHHLLHMLTGMLLSLALHREWSFILIIFSYTVHGLYLSHSSEKWTFYQGSCWFLLGVYMSEKWTF